MPIPPPHAQTDAIEVRKLGPLGPYANNAFILVDRATQQSTIIDAVPEVDQVLAAVVDTIPRMVLFTHSHPDHIASFDQLRAALDVPFYMHVDAPWADHDRIDERLTGGEAIALGETTIAVIHTPGHTPGSTCYYAAPYLVVGDTLFPGGPGHSTSNANLLQMITSITERIYPLPGETLMFNGHGDDCTIGTSRAEHAVFAARTHAADLHGDVLWARD